MPQPELTGSARKALKPVVMLLGSDATAPSSVIDPERAWRIHVADSISGLGFETLAEATTIDR